MKSLARHLEGLRRDGLLREPRQVEGPQGSSVILGGREVLLLCSNNYLGLADDPRVREAAAEAAIEWGAGAGASRLISGDMEPHRALERDLADFEGYESALLFGSGYLANTGVLAALAGEGEVIFSDQLNHASIIDGCRLSRAETVIYRHADIGHLRWCLENAAGRPSVIVTDGVFSMDGDLAPLGEIHQLAEEFGCRVVVDEAHATGTLGPGGRGTVAAAGLSGEIDVVVGTLGKALGSYGAYVCASAETTGYLVNTSRPFIFSTAPAPPSVGAAARALEILIAEPGRVVRLGANAATLRAGLKTQGLDPGDGETPIIPLIIGEAGRTMEICERALADGVFAQGIRPPTVPDGSSRLRLTVMATHTEAEMEHAAAVIGAAAIGATATVTVSPRSANTGADR